MKIRFSEADDLHLAQHPKVDSFSHLQEPKYRSDYFSQTEQLKHLNAPEQSSDADLLQKLNYQGQLQQFSSPNPLQQFPYFKQNQQFNQQGELEKLQTHNRAHELASVGVQQQLNYHDVHSYSNQLGQNDSNNDQPLNQHGEFEKREILNQTQMLHNTTGEHKETNYSGMLNHSNQFQQINHPQPIYQQGELENFRQLQLHKSAGENQQLNYQDVLNYLYQLQQQQHYRNHYQQQLGNLNQPPFRNSASEQHHIKYNDNLNYPSHGQPLNPSIQDQKLKQQGELEKLGNLNLAELNSTSGEHQQPQHNGTLKHPSQFQQSNYFGQDQQPNQHDNEVLATVLEKNSAYSEPRIEFPSYHHQSEHPHPHEHLHQHEHPSQHEHPQQHEHLSQHEHPQQHEHLSQHEHPHQPLNFVHLNVNEKYGYPNILPQLSSFGQYPRLNQQNNFEQPQHLNESLQIRYPREDQQLIYHDLSDTGVPANAPVNSSDISQPSLVPSDPQQQELSEVEKFMKPHNLNLNKNPGDAGGNLFHLNNPGQVPQPEQADPVVHSEHLSGTQPRSYLVEDHHLNPQGDGSNASGLGNIPDQSKLSQIPSDLPQKYPDQSEKNTRLSEQEKYDPSSHQQQFSNFGLSENPGPQFNRPDQLDQSAPSSYLHQSPNPANSWQPNQPVIFGQSNRPQQHSYSREAQLSNNGGIEVPAAGVEKNAAHPEQSQMPNHHYQQGYAPHAEEHRDLNANENSRYPGYLHQLSNPVQFRQFNPISFLPQFMHFNDPRMHGYLGQSQLPVSRDTRHPETELEANATYSKILQSSDHQQQQGHPGQVENSGDLILNQNSDLHDPQQLHSPDRIQQLNQSSHFEEPEHSDQSQQLINSTPDRELIIPGSDISSSNLEGNSNSSGFIHPETQEYPDKVDNSAHSNLTEQISQLNFSQPTQKLNSSGHPEKLMSPDELQLHANSTDDPQLTYSQLQHSDSQNQTQQLNTAEISQMQDISSQTGSAMNSTNNQSPILYTSGISQDQDTSNEAELSFYRSTTNLTSNESKIQEHSNADHPDSINQPGNLEEPQPHNNFTVDQQQNHFDFPNDNISASESEKSATHLQLSQPNYEGLRQEHKHENLDYPSQMGYFFRSVRPQRVNPFNQLNEPNHFIQPMFHPHPQVIPPGNQHFNYPSTGPEICYLEKTHGPCLAIIPRYFYDPVDRRCEKFIFGGCEGNANNFVTLEDCETMCMMHLQKGLPANEQIQPKKPDIGYENSALPVWHPGPDLVHEVCSLESRKGPCRAFFHRYFFNPATRSCEPFVYGGCYGNANNFFTKEECEFVCMTSL